MSDNENEKRETVENIVAEMRRREKSHCYPKVARNIMHQYSDRIEAAWKRERGYERVGNSDSFNAAAIRVALVRVLRLANVTADGENWDWNNAIAENVVKVVKEALAAPPRRCDVYDPEKAAHMIEVGYCSQMSPSHCDGTNCSRCSFKWFTSTTQEGGAK